MKLRSDEEDLIDEYMGSQKFQDLMEILVEGLYPVQLSEGWNNVVEAILKKYHEVIDPKEFVCPL